MRKLIGIAGIAAVAIFAFAQGGKDLLSGFSETLNKADSLSATYSFQQVGAAPSAYVVTLQKPNRARIDRPNELIVADGKTIVTLDKKSNTYFKKAQTAEDFGRLFADDDLNLWSSFFNKDALAKVAQTKSLGNKSRKGMTLAAVEAMMDKNGRKIVTFYLDSNKVARQAQITNHDPAGKSEWVIDAKEIALGNGGADTASMEQQFAFNAPNGSRELTEAEINSARWYHDLDEALKVAKATNKLVMVDFNATWCGPCQMLKRDVFPTEEFKAMGKYFVFCDIDTDEQPAIAKQFGANAIPDIRFLKSDGSEVHKIVGYRPKADFIAEMEKAKSAGGK